MIVLTPAAIARVKTILAGQEEKDALRIAVIGVDCSGYQYARTLDREPRKDDSVLTRIIHEALTAAADPGMSAALRSVGLLGVLSSTPAGSSVARLASIPVCAASLRTFMNNAG